jgi:hypothetical protein
VCKGATLCCACMPCVPVASIATGAGTHNPAALAAPWLRTNTIAAAQGAAHCHVYPAEVGRFARGQSCKIPTCALDVRRGGGRAPADNVHMCTALCYSGS